MPKSALKVARLGLGGKMQEFFFDNKNNCPLTGPP